MKKLYFRTELEFDFKSREELNLDCLMKSVINVFLNDIDDIDYNIAVDNEPCKTAYYKKAYHSVIRITLTETDFRIEDHWVRFIKRNFGLCEITFNISAKPYTQMV